MPFTANRPTSWELKEILEGEQLQRASYIIDATQEFTALMKLDQENLTEDEAIYDDSVGCFDNSTEQELYEELPDFFDSIPVPEVQQQDKSRTDTKVILVVYKFL